jgi:lipopolysaccharide export LptBFGC system permease protein LptF
MTPFLPLIWAWLRGLVHPVLVAWCGLIGVALLGLVCQLLVQTPVVPSLRGVVAIAAGLLPEVAAMMLPVALFFATVGLARRWADAGDLGALFAVGMGGRRLLPILVLVGSLGGLMAGVLSHGVAPAGRRLARRTIAQAGSTLSLQAGRPTWIGGTLVMAEQTESSQLRSVFVAQGDVVATAPLAIVTSQGVVELQGGSARGLGEAEWSLRFERLRIPLRMPPPRSHSFDMSGGRLAALISRMERQGRSPHAERLVLLKRTTLALGTPLLVVLALPLGAGTRWGLPGAVGTIVSLWGIQRMGDHMAATWGALPSAVLPLLVLALGAAIAWRAWAPR